MRPTTSQRFCAPPGGSWVLATWAALMAAACGPASAGSGAAPAPIATAGTTGSARPAHWGYDGELGPAHWAELSSAYAACARGAQSPIDITKAAQGEAAWRTDYRSTGLTIAHHEHVTDILDNGHTIQVTVDHGSTLITGRGTYSLKQFHFHTPSEHTVGGKSFPMEVHFVHQSEAGDFAVLAVLVEEGAANGNLAPLIANLPAHKGEVQHLPEVKLELSLQLPPHSEAYSYLGSFTTPPCTESVEWLILRAPITASSEQLQTFAARLNHNNRPLQQRNDRAIATGQITGSFEP